MPVFPYKVRTKDGIKERAFSIRDFKLNECPVSVITKNTIDSRKPDYINGPRAAELVRLWHKARRSKTTLSKLLGSNAAWLEDVEDVLNTAQATVDAEQRKAVDSRIG